ncbi:uncharacterized protein N7515_008670 [Penicillium bovifimosum]|uniref:Uncharacterized protein n=1 Tax=Penicillium bovifimosum TaxID=126998 RepID=A0A9W9GPX8_9EURO|nr:uncharacterized protein N7515_008670 [Penicillium bovifimosum]KAJ5124845.1 hypothetical protein N7515_008670 [Penicillium bovifimosum]
MHSARIFKPILGKLTTPDLVVAWRVWAARPSAYIPITISSDGDHVHIPGRRHPRLPDSQAQLSTGVLDNDISTANCRVLEWKVRRSVLLCSVFNGEGKTKHKGQHSSRTEHKPQEPSPILGNLLTPALVGAFSIAAAWPSTHIPITAATDGHALFNATTKAGCPAAVLPFVFCLSLSIENRAKQHRPSDFSLQNSTVCCDNISIQHTSAQLGLRVGKTRMPSSRNDLDVIRITAYSDGDISTWPSSRYTPRDDHIWRRKLAENWLKDAGTYQAGELSEML